MFDMTPVQAARALRRIAAKIDNSKNPDRRLVIAELQRVIAATDAGVCPACRGTGGIEYDWGGSNRPEWVPCKECNGTGRASGKEQK